MVSLTLSVPEELKKEMDQFPEMNWSAIARAAIKRKVMLLIEMERLLSKSKLTQEDAIALGRKVNKEVTRKHYS